MHEVIGKEKEKRQTAKFSPRFSLQTVERAKKVAERRQKRELQNTVHKWPYLDRSDSSSFAGLFHRIKECLLSLASIILP